MLSAAWKDVWKFGVKRPFERRLFSANHASLAYFEHNPRRLWGLKSIAFGLSVRFAGPLVSCLQARAVLLWCAALVIWSYCFVESLRGRFP